MDDVSCLPGLLLDESDFKSISIPFLRDSSWVVLLQYSFHLLVGIKRNWRFWPYQVQVCSYISPPDFHCMLV